MFFTSLDFKTDILLIVFTAVKTDIKTEFACLFVREKGGPSFLPRLPCSAQVFFSSMKRQRDGNTCARPTYP